MNALTRGLALLLLTMGILQMAACTQYVPPTTGLPSRQNWLEGGGG